MSRCAMVSQDWMLDRPALPAPLTRSAAKVHSQVKRPTNDPFVTPDRRLMSGRVNFPVPSCSGVGSVTLDDRHAFQSFCPSHRIRSWALRRRSSVTTSLSASGPAGRYTCRQGLPWTDLPRSRLRLPVLPVHDSTQWNRYIPLSGTRLVRTVCSGRTGCHRYGWGLGDRLRHRSRSGGPGRERGHTGRQQHGKRGSR